MQARSGLTQRRCERPGLLVSGVHGLQVVVTCFGGAHWEDRSFRFGRSKAVLQRDMVSLQASEKGRGDKM